MGGCGINSKGGNDFAEFFYNKIAQIRNNLTQHAPFVPRYVNIDGHMSDFNPITEEELDKILKSSNSTTCVLDPFPSPLLMKYKSVILPALTKIVNSSLQQAKFDESWKMAVIKPLLKKQGLPLTQSNYRPVSNLQFISKITEKCALNQ